MKGYNKLIIQILTLATIMFCMSFVSEIPQVEKLLFESSGKANYRYLVYNYTGAVLFIITAIRIAMSVNSKDFN